MNFNFPRIKRLPPYVFNEVDKLKREARAAGKDIIDFGMGNPDQATPKHIVDKLIEKVQDPTNHRYSSSKGIPNLRKAICSWYDRNHGVSLDFESEAIVTIGSKEGISHLALALFDAGDTVMVPTPTYPIHSYAMYIANADVVHIPLLEGGQKFFETLKTTYESIWPRPKALLINFPHNPTTASVDLEFFEEVVDFAKSNNVLIMHDFAYADIAFDGYKPPSFLQAKGAKDVGVEFYTLSKSYNMPGWRVGFTCGNKEIIAALTRIKSYLDYGMFQPLQIASIIALNGDQQCVTDICDLYKKRRDVLCEGLNRIGWKVEPPRSSMFVWARIPEKYRAMGSLEFTKFAVENAEVAFSPGIGFGPGGEEYVRIALVENENRIRQAIRNLKKIM